MHVRILRLFVLLTQKENAADNQENKTKQNKKTGENVDEIESP
jgi:hypothetical protein